MGQYTGGMLPGVKISKWNGEITVEIGRGLGANVDRITISVDHLKAISHWLPAIEAATSLEIFIPDKTAPT